MPDEGAVQAKVNARIARSPEGSIRRLPHRDREFMKRCRADVEKAGELDDLKLHPRTRGVDKARKTVQLVRPIRPGTLLTPLRKLAGSDDGNR